MDGFKPKTNPEATERVAVIAIHGVADQKAGETARAVTSLLINTGNAAVHYGQGQCDTILIATPLVPPIVAHPPVACDRLRNVLVDNQNGSFSVNTLESPPVPPLQKALRQSVRSDFQRPGWTAVTGLNEVEWEDERPVVEVNSRSGPPTNAPQDLGIAFSDYLLFKAQRNGCRSDSYEAARIQMTRAAAGGPEKQDVDVFEMYWADLSRMSGAVPRIVAEIFTLMFRFARLGRDAVDHAAGQHEASGSPTAQRWKQLALLQRTLDLALSQILSNLALQLLVLGAVISLLGVAFPYAEKVASVIIWSVALTMFLWYCYSYSRSNASRLLAALATGVAVYLLHAVPAHLVVGLAWLATLVWLCDLGLRVAEDRFPAVRPVGLVFLAATGLALLGHVALHMSVSGSAEGLHIWVYSAIRLLEYVLFLIVFWWAVVPLLMAAWLIVGQLIISGGDERALASVVTARLGLFLSVVLFVVAWMALWALITSIVEYGAIGLIYSPQTFFEKPGPQMADVYLHERYLKSTESFALVAALALLLLCYLVMMLLPSILAEVKSAIGTPFALGRWLSSGYRHLGRAIAIVVMLSVAAACTVGILMFFARFGTFLKPDQLSLNIAHLSETILKPLVLTAASIAAMISAFGGVLSRYLPWLRLPLDVSLDVDNHFREFPRNAIPRARIFSRYVALLEHIAEQEYDRIVIVAHSQGTMITVELLRYLQYRARQPGILGPETDRIRLLWTRLEGRIDLMTAGCPLRQLYAARFPELYAWAAGDPAQGGGPSPGDVGVNRWINIYTTGDYVGRWLWSPASPGQTVYDKSTAPPSYDVTRCDVCLGSGAHTHYFDQDQHLVAGWLDTLIHGRTTASAM